MSVIFHLVRKSEWEGRSSLQEYSAPSLAQEGFNHCSENEGQLLAVARRLYAGEVDLLVLELETDLLTSRLMREPSRSGEVYPHIYGPINTHAVVAVRELLTGNDGEFFLGEPNSG
ncbi:MAG: hypothetical protein BZY88_19200 [SAR202 cluster bacterium Io17-Chloro-G9]|nr:MAG: hypothetical protein BZY88_19200 [SAR202 cluster bacterium Io17-Chloro-G9]